MTAGRIVFALALTTLAGCDDRMGDYPALLPTDQVLAEPAIPGHAAAAAQDPASVSQGLRSRAAALQAQGPSRAVSDASALQGRAAGLAANPPGTLSGGDALGQRADALRARAKELSGTSLDACPEDETCPPAATETGTPPAGQ